MKIDLLTKDSESQYEAQAPQKRERVLDSSQRKIKGHKLFEYNTVTGEMKEAEILRIKQDYFVKSLTFNPADCVIKTVVVKKANCIYRQALNAKNLIKILKRQGIIQSSN